MKIKVFGDANGAGALPAPDCCPLEPHQLTMVDDIDTLAFRVSTENLNGAIEILRALGGLEAYPEAYQVLILERSSRELQTAPNEIRLQRKTFEALPRDVQQKLAAG
jgi:hypothetical protein